MATTTEAPSGRHTRTPVVETIAVHRQGDGRLEVAETLGRGDTLRTGLLNGLQLELDDVSAS